jgi:hypothetical protein
MNLLDFLRKFAAECTHPAGSTERIAALRDALAAYRTDNPDETVDLTALDTAAMTAFETARGGTLDAAALADMQVLADVCDATRELAAQDQAAADEIAAQAQALAARVGGDAPADPPAEGGEGDNPEGGEPAPADPPAEPAPAEPTAPAGEPALVAGARNVPARRVPLNGLPNHRRASPAGVGRDGYSWRAAADIRGIAAGQAIGDVDTLVRAAQTRMQSFSRAGMTGQHQAGIATIDRSTRNGEFVFDDGPSVEMIERLTSESRLEGGSLVAAGGWCAPSETLYDLLPGADANAGIVNVPTMTARRGGVRWPATPQFSAIYGTADASFYQTEATVIAGVTPKPCYEIPCTTYTEIRLGVAGVCIRSPILTERGFPELVSSVTAETLAAHAHKVNQRKIAAMVAGGTAVTMTTAEVTTLGTAGYTASILTAIELQVEYLRYRHRWPTNTTIEAVLPLWSRLTFRADLASRNGVPSELDVTDAQVDAWLRSRGVNPQWVYDWQDSFATGVGGDFGGTTPPKAFPTGVTMLLYRAGTFFIAESDVITVDGLYDSTLLAANMHLAYFTEEGFAVGKKDWPAIALTVPVRVSGLSGAQVAAPATSGA